MSRDHFILAHGLFRYARIAGGFEQGATNYMTRVAIYTIYTGDGTGPHDAEYSVLWLKALGIQAVA